MKTPFLTVILFVLSLPAFSDTTTLVNDANKLCGEIARFGFTDELLLSGTAKAELDNIIKKLGLNVGISGSAEGTFKKFSGVQQKDLANAIKAGNNCKLEALKMLKEYSLEIEKMKVREPSASEKISGQIKNCLNESRIDCEGLGYKIREAIVRCQNNIRGQNTADRALASNKCGSIGMGIQIQALMKQVNRACAKPSSQECKTAKSNARYHSDEAIIKLSEMIAENT